jgi:hypothetical protein
MGHNHNVTPPHLAEAAQHRRELLRNTHRQSDRSSCPEADQINVGDLRKSVQQALKQDSGLRTRPLTKAEKSVVFSNS